VLNPYDPCVANKIINKKQFTVCFHVDDCKLSHRQPKVMDRMIKWLRHEQESIFEDGSGEMTVSRVKAHEHLGMTLDYCVRGQVTHLMQCLRHFEVVGGCIIHGPPKHERTLWGRIVDGPGISHRWR
jgi:hypothetical protein